MIISIRANNSYIFNDEVELSLEADMRTSRFGFNVNKMSDYNVLKSLGIFGPNNVGKTCLINSIKSIKKVILNDGTGIQSNFFNDSTIVEMGVTFLYEKNKYSYDFKYDVKLKEFVYEKFCSYSIDKNKNEKTTEIFVRDIINKINVFEDSDVKKMLGLASKGNIMIHLFDDAENKSIKKIKDILIGFAEKIDFINMNKISTRKTLEILKNKNRIQEKLVNFIINADLDLDNIKYDEDPKMSISVLSETGDEEVNIPDELLDQLRLTSVYKGKSVPSMLFDSVGTKKIIALSSYVIEALENDRILIVDELDSSLHFKLTRAIVSMFNNELNENSQLIFSGHDINLMDCKKLFRKEQIWFLHKDQEGVYLYSLKDFTAEDGIRSNSDIIEKYKKGALGAVPDPNFINTLLEVHNEK